MTDHKAEPSRLAFGPGHWTHREGHGARRDDLEAQGDRMNNKYTVVAVTIGGERVAAWITAPTPADAESVFEFGYGQRFFVAGVFEGFIKAVDA